MAWWLWALSAIALLGFEVVTPGGLVAIFFAAGALLVAPLAALGLDPVAQWLVFSAASLASLALLRSRLLSRLGHAPHAEIDAIVGQEVVVLADIPAGGEGKAELRGSPWIARVADGGVPAGARCRVERVEGVTLWLRRD